MAERLIVPESINNKSKNTLLRKALGGWRGKIAAASLSLSSIAVAACMPGSAENPDATATLPPTIGGCPTDIPTDVNGDGWVDTADILLIHSSDSLKKCAVPGNIYTEGSSRLIVDESDIQSVNLAQGATEKNPTIDGINRYCKPKDSNRDGKIDGIDQTIVQERRGLVVEPYQFGLLEPTDLNIGYEARTLVIIVNNETADTFYSPQAEEDLYFKKGDDINLDELAEKYKNDGLEDYFKTLKGFLENQNLVIDSFGGRFNVVHVKTDNRENADDLDTIISKLQKEQSDFVQSVGGNLDGACPA